MATLGHGLMITTPYRPAEHFFPAQHSSAQNQPPQELARFGDRQFDESPRFLLKASRLHLLLLLLLLSVPSFFRAPFCCDASMSWPLARMAARKAWAKRAREIGRAH